MIALLATCLLALLLYCLKACMSACRGAGFRASGPCLAVQELEEEALRVMKAASSTEELLKERAQSLAEIRAEYERKQKEVCKAMRPVI
jgi:hypothetical protein